MDASAEKAHSNHRLFKAALAFPAFAGLTVASYTLHGSIVTAVFLYDALCHRRQLGQRRAAMSARADDCVQSLR
jgi:hypothetical protein